MKKITFIGMAALLLGISTINTGCMGSWAITKKVYQWNDGATGNKYLDNILFWVLGGVQVYSATLFLDSCIFNLIQFWTGSNTMAMKEGEKDHQVVMGKDGNQYDMTAVQNRFDIVALTGAHKGSTTSFIYNPTSSTWSKQINGGEITPFAVMHQDLNKVELISADGSVHMADMSDLYLMSN